MTHKQASLVGSIEELLAETGGYDKSSEAYTEAGGYDGPSTHPSTDADDRTEKATEGSRSAENTKDVKEEPNRGQVVDSTTPGPGAGQDSVQTNIGITTKATGEDPANETDKAKPGKDDGGTIDGDTAHPARTDNDALDGHKYSFDLLKQLSKESEDLGADILASVAVGSDRAYRQTSKSATATPADEKAAAEEAAVAGYDIAGVFANTDIAEEDKAAATQVVYDHLENLISTAVRRAEKCAAVYASHFSKLANDMPQPAAPVGGEEMPPEAMGGGGGGEEEALMAMLAGGGGEGGMPPEAGGMPPEAGGGEMPPEAMGGGGGEEEELAMLEQILAELQNAEAGGEGGEELPPEAMGGGGGELPPEALAGGGEGPKLASDKTLNKAAMIKKVVEELIKRSQKQ